MDKKKPIKLLLVEDHNIVRQGMIALLAADPGIEVVAEAHNCDEAIERVRHNQPDVVLMDIGTPVANGLECTQKIKYLFPQKKILVLSMQDHESYLISMLDAGADGYILKNSSKEELFFAIRKVANDSMYIGPEFTMNMLAKYKAAQGFIAQTAKVSVPISDREKDVLHLIADGLTNTEMAQKLYTSVRTIETRRKNLLIKTGTTNTATLIKFAVKNGMIN